MTPASSVFPHYSTLFVFEKILNRLSGILTGTKGKQVEAETLMENEAVINLLENMGFEREAWGMRVSLNEDGKVVHNNTIGLRRFRLNGETRLVHH